MPIKLAGGLLGGGRDPFTGQPIMLPKSTGPEQAGEGASWGLGQIVQPWQLLGRKTPEEGGSTFKRAVTDQVLDLKDSSDAAVRARQRAEKVLRKAAEKRRAHPHGLLEQFIENLSGGD